MKFQTRRLGVVVRLDRQRGQKEIRLLEGNFNVGGLESKGCGRFGP